MGCIKLLIKFIKSVGEEYQVWKFISTIEEEYNVEIGEWDAISSSLKAAEKNVKREGNLGEEKNQDQKRGMGENIKM